ncbi:MAG: response regulator transcription factor, partial [Thermoleophilia bacterium]|nr:response regulator transcription factor [Thermoleophilia bacterium]
MLARDQVDLCLLDKAFGTQAILSWLAEMKLSYRVSAAFVVWGASISEAEALRLLQQGVKGILRKTAEPHLVLACLEAVANGASWIDETLLRRTTYRKHQPCELTPREQQILALVREGLKNKEIAEELGIRPGTVKIHLKHIFEKTGIRSRYGLALSGLGQRKLAGTEGEHIFESPAPEQRQLERRSWDEGGGRRASFAAR